MTELDFIWVKKIYKHHLRYFKSVEVITNEVIESNIGFNYNDFSKFIAVLKGFSDYFVTLSRSFKFQISENNPPEDNEKLMSEIRLGRLTSVESSVINACLGNISPERLIVTKNIVKYDIDQI